MHPVSYLATLWGKAHANGSERGGEGHPQWALSDLDGFLLLTSQRWVWVQCNQYVGSPTWESRIPFVIRDLNSINTHLDHLLCAGYSEMLKGEHVYNRAVGMFK